MRKAVRVTRHDDGSLKSHARFPEQGSVSDLRRYTAGRSYEETDSRFCESFFGRSIVQVPRAQSAPAS